MKKQSVTLVLLVATLLTGHANAQEKATDTWLLNPADFAIPVSFRQELELNLQWMISREQHRKTVAHSEPVVGVYVDAGVWHLGAKSIVYALEREGIPCHLLDHDTIGDRDLAKLKAVIVPGGYSVYMRPGFGEEGVRCVRQHIDSGGTYLGVCAGAYFAAKQVRWESVVYPYPLALFDGTADGPLSQIAPWPVAASVKLDVVDPHDDMALLGQGRVYYMGGCRLTGGSGVKPLATYPDKTNAVIERSFGQGRLCLLRFISSALHQLKTPKAKSVPRNLLDRFFCRC